MVSTLIARFKGQHVGPRWAPCWPHEFCYLGTTALNPQDHFVLGSCFSHGHYSVMQICWRVERSVRCIYWRGGLEHIASQGRALECIETYSQDSILFSDQDYRSNVNKASEPQPDWMYRPRWIRRVYGIHSFQAEDKATYCAERIHFNMVRTFRTPVWYPLISLLKNEWRL